MEQGGGDGGGRVAGDVAGLFGVLEFRRAGRRAQGSENRWERPAGNSSRETKPGEGVKGMIPAKLLDCPAIPLY